MFDDDPYPADAVLAITLTSTITCYYCSNHLRSFQAQVIFSEMPWRTSLYFMFQSILRVSELA